MTPDEQAIHKQHRQVLADWLKTRSNGVIEVMDFGAIPNVIMWIPTEKETSSPEEHIKFL